MKVPEAIVSALLEDDGDEVDLGQLLGDVHDDELDDPGSKVEIRVVPCVDDGLSVTHLVYARLTDPNMQPMFWTVYKRIHHSQVDEQPEYAMSDHDTPEEANIEAERLKRIYRGQGRLIE